MVQYLASFIFLVVLAASVQGEYYAYSKLMTPDWLYKNAQFESPSVIVSHNVKRLTLRSTVNNGRLFTVPLPSRRFIQGEVAFKVRVSLQKPSGDSDLFVGIGNAKGYSASAFIVDNRPYPRPLAAVNSVTNLYNHADVVGSSLLTASYDEEITFIYKPAEQFGAFYSGNNVVTGIFSNAPDLDKDIYLVVTGQDAGETYKLQYIHVEITNI